MDPLYISPEERIKYEIIENTDIKSEPDPDPESNEIISEEIEQKPIIKTEELDLEEDVIILSDDDGSECFLCDQCGFVSFSESLFTRHKVHHVEPTEKKFKCEECPFEAFYKADLNKHISEKHSLDLESLRQSTPLLESILKDKEAMMTYKKSLLEANNTAKQDEEATPTNKKPLLLEAYITAKLSNNKPKQKIFYCGGKCPFNTDSADVLSKHVKQEHSQGATCSKITDAKFKSEQLQKLRIVRKVVNLNSKPSVYRCTICDYKNHSRVKVISHLRWSHPVPPKPTIETVTWYKCGTCCFKSKTEQLVQSHIENFHLVTKTDVTI